MPAVVDVINAHNDHEDDDAFKCESQARIKQSSMVCDTAASYCDVINYKNPIAVSSLEEDYCAGDDVSEVLVVRSQLLHYPCSRSGRQVGPAVLETVLENVPLQDNVGHCSSDSLDTTLLPENEAENSLEKSDGVVELEIKDQETESVSDNSDHFTEPTSSDCTISLEFEKPHCFVDGEQVDCCLVDNSDSCALASSSESSSFSQQQLQQEDGQVRQPVTFSTGSPGINRAAATIVNASSHSRTHARHSSYDVVVSGGGELNSSLVAAQLQAQLNRTNSLNKGDGSSLSSSFSTTSLSVSDFSSAASIVNDNFSEAGSKRSSLDRKSQVSAAENWAEFEHSSVRAGPINASRLVNGLSSIFPNPRRLLSVLKSTVSGSNSNVVGDLAASHSTGNKRYRDASNLSTHHFSAATGDAAVSPLSHVSVFHSSQSCSSLDVVHQNSIGLATGDHENVSIKPAEVGFGGNGRRFSGFCKTGANLNFLAPPLSRSPATPESGISIDFAQPPSRPDSNCAVRSNDITVSTTALILEERPKHLPSKSQEEAERHRKAYEQMIEAARKKDLKDAKLRRKQQESQAKQEVALAAAVREWNEVLCQWNKLHCTKHVRNLWWQGLPSSVRGKVWKLAIGNDLNITKELYEICAQKAAQRLHGFGLHSNSASPSEEISETSVVHICREDTVELIHLDVSRTFPHLAIFQKGGPFFDLLLTLLGAYVCFRPDVGYVQGMSFIAAVLLLNIDVPEAFICFANLLNRPCLIAFYRMLQDKMDAYFSAYSIFFQEQLPKLHAHFRNIEITPNLYLLEWLFTLYAKNLPLDIACRIWDVYLRDGEEFLFRSALGILNMYEEVLLKLDFDHVVQFLTHLPDTVSAAELFHSIEQLKFGAGCDKRKFPQIFSEIISCLSLPQLGATTTTLPS